MNVLYEYRTKIGDGFFNNIIEKLGDYNIELHLPADKGEYVPNSSCKVFKNIHMLDLGLSICKERKKDIKVLMN